MYTQYKKLNQLSSKKSNALESYGVHFEKKQIPRPAPICPVRNQAHLLCKKIHFMFSHYSCMLQWCYNKFAVRVQPTKEMWACAREAQCLLTSLEIWAIVGLEAKTHLPKSAVRNCAEQNVFLLAWKKHGCCIPFFFIFQQTRGKLVSHLSFCFFSLK